VSVAPELIYLEADDEVTGVVRRLRSATALRVIVVAPGRSRATSSTTALRLLRRAAERAGRELAVVGDPLTRSLAAEAGIVAYGSVDDARTARAAGAGASAVQQAPIRIVRAAADAPPPTDPEATVAAMPAIRDADTRAVPVARPRAATGRRRRGPWPLVGGAAALLIGALVLGLAVLPAATIRIVPRTSAVGPVAYSIVVGDAERVTGSVQARSTATATGTYPISEPASGSVVLFNWTFQPVFVPAGTFVAAGEQAFATQADVTVPRGRLTLDGRIAAGDVTVAVLAAAPGPAGNVDAHAIDTVVNEGVDQQLRGFPENPERRVDNADATSGGAEDTGPEFTQADVDAAVAELTDALEAEVARALGESGDAVFADAAAAPEPVIEGVDGLVGTRDQPTAELSGTLAYDRLSAPAEDVRAQAREQFASEAGERVPPGMELAADATRVELGAARREGDALVVAVTVTGAAAAAIDPDAVVERVAGRSVADAVANLADLGDATIDLWPGWVTSVPGGAWRIEVIPQTDDGTASPSAGAS
jgi:hypothetical protein